MFEDRGGARAFVGIRQDLVTSYDLPRIYGHDSLRSQFATALSLNARSKNREKFVLEGGLISYGPDASDIFRRTGSYVDRLLRGEKPANLPVQSPTKFELVINLIAAKALGLTVRDSFLLLADEVIE